MEVWQTSNLQRLRLGEEKKERRRRKKNKPQHENIYMVSLFHRATIKKNYALDKTCRGYIFVPL